MVAARESGPRRHDGAPGREGLLRAAAREEAPVAVAGVAGVLLGRERVPHAPVRLSASTPRKLGLLARVPRA